MTKRLCKLSRHEIASHLSDIHQLVAEPKFMCRSCARSSTNKESLCKPNAIPPSECQSKPFSEKVKCGLLVEAMPTITPRQIPDESIKAQSVVNGAEKNIELVTAEDPQIMDNQLSDKGLKAAKKALKKQKKYNKQLKKVLKKQKKLLKQHDLIEKKFEKANRATVMLGVTNTSSSHPVH